MSRDNFSAQTKELLAKRVGYLCSNPECRTPTVGAAQSHDGVVNVGVAAHITAAAPGGKRFDASLKSEDRTTPSNGIWLCQNHAKLIDSDEAQYPVDLLHRWKRDAESRAFRAIAGGERFGQAAGTVGTGQSGLHGAEDPEAVGTRLLELAAGDLTAFKRMVSWPRCPVALSLRRAETASSDSFHAAGLAAAIGAFNEITIIAQPGTGKTTTLLQIADAMVAQTQYVPLFIPLGEWATQSISFLQAIARRLAFQTTQERDFMLLARHGRLALLLDGWNELDVGSRARATTELRQLRRDFPNIAMVISTRRQARDVPLTGPIVEIGSLNEAQQFEMARALRGAEGEALLDHALRTPGIRGLVSIPLYLSVLLTRVRNGVMPTTKAEVLELFVSELEQPAETAEALHGTLFGHHRDMLTALAADATSSAGTAITDNRARAVVTRVATGLVADGQISVAPQPSDVLDMLVSRHTLVRSSSGSGTFSFQHQQFLEWFASFEAERTMRDAAAGKVNQPRRLRVEMLNQPVWEEAILFACERLSRADQASANVVGVAVLLTLSIDPMFAAEMIYRSAPAIWDRIGGEILDFVWRWHTRGTVDRAVRFMVTSGRPEFAGLLWPLVSSADSQIYLSTLRAGHRFRPSVLGPDAAVRLATIPTETRQHVLAEIAIHGSIDGIALATAVARSDPSADVLFAVIRALQFRRADRWVAKLLNIAPPEVWSRLAAAGDIAEIADPALAARLRAEQARQVDAEVDPWRRIGMLLAAPNQSPSNGEQIRRAIEAANLTPMYDWQHASWALHEASRRYPREVVNALLRHLENGGSLPFQAERLLAAAPAIDEGRIVERAIDITTEDRSGELVASLVGPDTAGRMIDNLIALGMRVRAATGQSDRVMTEQLYRLQDRLAATRASSFVPALLQRGGTDRPAEIGLLTQLVGHYGNKGPLKEPVTAVGELIPDLIALLRRWSETLLSSPDSRRDQMANLAAAIGQLGRPELVPELKGLLAEDLARWRQARDTLQADPGRATVGVRSEAMHSWTNFYRRASEQIGGDRVAAAMGDYLENVDFGGDAAYVLRAVWERQTDVPPADMSKRWPDFSNVRERRADRQSRQPHPSSTHADMIFQAIKRLIQQEPTEAQQILAIRLGRIALSMPHGNDATLTNALLALPQPIRTKRELLAALVLDGEIISADPMLEGVSAWVEDARQNSWMIQQGLWEIEGWIELLPFSDRPEATLDAVELVGSLLSHPHVMERVVYSLAHAPAPEAEQTLYQLARRCPRLAYDRGWVQALLQRGTTSAAAMLIELVGEGRFVQTDAPDIWGISEELAGLARQNSDLRSELWRRYEETAASPVERQLIEQTLVKTGELASLLLVVRGYARLGKPYDSLINQALREVAFEKHPVAAGSGTYQLVPVPLTELRKRLFGMLGGTEQESSLAKACLEEIDELRDLYGSPEAEPRHPHIESERPWPLAAEASA